MKNLTFIGLLAVAMGYAIATRAQADITLNLTATSRQVIVTYTSPDTNACTVEVSEESDFSPLVNDVNTALFSGSNTDSRSGALGVGTTTRTFIAGTIPSMNGVLDNLASDGQRYGRALRPNTEHFVRVTCGSHTGTSQITTKNIPLGLTRNEEQPIASAGVYAFPTISNYTNRSETFIDPVTGMRLKKVTLPGDHINTDDLRDTNFSTTGLGTNWTNASSVLANDSNSATYSATTNDKLAIKVSYSFSDAYALDAFRVYVRGHSDVSTGNNNVLSACLTLDGSTCARGTVSRDYTLPLSSDDLRCQPNGGTETSCGSDPVPIDTWTEPKLRREEVVGNANFGVLVWKKGTGTGTITLQHVFWSSYSSINGHFVDAGAAWVCAQQTTNDSSATPGYLCQIPMESGTGFLVWVNETTGEIRQLGWMGYFGQLSGIGSRNVGTTSSTFDGSDPTKMYFMLPDTNGDDHVVRCQLPASGNSYYNASVGQAAFSCTWTDLTPNPNNLPALMTAFEPDFDKAVFNGGGAYHTQGQYIIFSKLRGVQDSYGFVGAFNTSNNTVAALIPLWKRGGTADKSFRWCGIHTFHQALGTNKMSFTAKAGYQDIKGSHFTVTLNGAINNSQTTVTLSSNSPLGNDGVGHNESLYDIAVDDEIQVDSEAMYITGFVSGTTWTVQRGRAGTTAASHSNGAQVLMACRAHQPGDLSQVGPSWWDFETDPHGNDTTGTSLIARLTDDNLFNGHEGWANGRKLSEGSWHGCIAAAGVACSPTLVISNQPTFAGGFKSSPSNGWQPHPGGPQQTNAATAEKVWSVDILSLDTDTDLRPTTLTNVTGTLFKWTNTNYSLDRKRLAMLGICGVKPLLDVSSTATGNVMGGTSGDNYKYCVANAANECRTGSVTGEMYFNCPQVTTGSTCPGGGTFPYSDKEDEICFGHLPPYGSNLNQIGIIEATSAGKYIRRLSQIMSGVRQTELLANAHVTPSGKWAMFLKRVDNRWDVWMAELPPWPAYDGTDRNTFINRVIGLSGPANTTTVLLKFGYDTSFNCTSRTEACVSANSNNPYFFNSESFTRITCSGGICNPTIPMIADRVAYVQPTYFDSGGGIISVGATIAVTDGLAATASGPSSTTQGRTSIRGRGTIRP